MLLAGASAVQVGHGRRSSTPPRRWRSREGSPLTSRRRASPRPKTSGRGCGCRRGSESPRSHDPAARGSDRRRPRRLDARGGRAARGAPGAPRRDAEGRARARVVGRARRRPPRSRRTGRSSSTQAARHPDTVERAAANVARLGVAMLNVHALGGEAMMRAAARRARAGAPTRRASTPPLVVAVTVLSSHAGEGLASPASLAFEAKAAGLDGVVVSGEDVRGRPRDAAARSSASWSPASDRRDRTDTIRCVSSRRAKRSNAARTTS